MAKWNYEANEIFLEVLEHESFEARRAHLDSACRDKPKLRAEVESLLAAHANVGSFLETPAMGTSPTAAPPIRDKVGATIGPYKLLQQLGEGGMGVVYLAEQGTPVKRRVALKILRPGMDSRQVITRFEVEEQTLALMDHPHIAKVLDAGATEDGRPYFVMELVKGVPITDYCDQHRLTPLERLQLYIPVCEAVQHAHQKGIIHRDIKPTNVLVALYDGKPVPKVIDFGVAKATGQKLTDKTMFTQFGQIIGTLEYMSPEQATLNQLDIDTRSDIYSLGVLLYELLTGCTPFDKQRLRNATVEEMMRIIREEDPPKPSTRLTTIQTLATVAAKRQIEPRKLGAVVRGELDWIVMKSLEKDRSRRYETASAFAKDIARYLQNEPVEASPPSKVYLFTKFASKHRALITTTALILLVLVGATGVSLWNAARAREAHAAADEAREKAVAANRRAEERANLALRVITSMYEDISWLAETPGLEDVRQDYVNRAIALFRQLEKEKQESAEVRYYLGELSRQLAALYQEWGRYEEADQYARAAIELFNRNIDGRNVRIDTHLPLARALSQLAYVQYLRGEMESSLEHNNQSIQICESLCAAHPDNILVLRQLRISLENRGSTLDGLTRYDECESCRRRALELSERLAVIMPNDSETACALGAALHNLATLHQHSGEGELAKELLQRAVESQQRSLTLNPDSKNARRFLANHYHQLGRVTSEQFGRLQEAADWYLKELNHRQTLTSDFPRHLSYRLDVANCYNSLANVLRCAENVDAALEMYQQAKRQLDQLAIEFPANKQVQYQRAAALANIALLLQTTGENQRALTLIEQAQQELRRLTRATSAQDLDFLARVHQWKAGMLWFAGESDEAVSTEMEAVEARRSLVRLCPTDIRQWSQLGLELHFLARLRLASDDSSQAYALLKEAVSWQLKAHHEKPGDAAIKSRLCSHQSLLAFCAAMAKDGECDLDEAEAYARAALDIAPDDSNCWQSLGMVQYRRQEWELACESLREADELSPDGVSSFGAFLLAMSHHRLGDDAAASSWFEKAMEAMPREDLFQTQLRRLCQEAEELTGLQGG